MQFAGDKETQDKLLDIKAAKKKEINEYFKKKQGIYIVYNFIFVVQFKLLN